ncbi:unnamed protein product [Ambrosiozyma monospora]|uniref:Unnamed protein product n=1 Tax=Ambrosiozyma monospora TaxID=43982 RepID=A0A9W7DGE9_AMBMO|nr:unnamed protein product [Ambrosiozyma monospora]
MADPFNTRNDSAPFSFKYDNESLSTSDPYNNRYDSMPNDPFSGARSINASITTNDRIRNNVKTASTINDTISSRLNPFNPVNTRNESLPSSGPFSSRQDSLASSAATPYSGGDFVINESGGGIHCEESIVSSLERSISDASRRNLPSTLERNLSSGSKNRRLYARNDSLASSPNRNNSSNSSGSNQKLPNNIRNNEHFANSSTRLYTQNPSVDSFNSNNSGNENYTPNLPPYQQFTRPSGTQQQGGFQGEVRESQLPTAPLRLVREEPESPDVPQIPLMQNEIPPRSTNRGQPPSNVTNSALYGHNAGFKYN